MRKPSTRMRRPTAYTPFWDAKTKTWKLYDHNGNLIISRTPLSNDLLDVLDAFILIDKIARRHADAYINRIMKNKWAA